MSLILFNISCGIYSIPKESKYAAVFLSINNETQWVSLLYLPSRFMIYAPSFILGKLPLEKTPLNLGLLLKYLILIMLKGLSGTKKFIYPFLASLIPLLLIPFTTEEISGCTNEKALTC